MDVAKSKPKGGMDAATKASTRKTCPNGTFSTVSNRLRQSAKGGTFLFARIQPIHKINEIFIHQCIAVTIKLHDSMAVALKF